MSKNIQSLSHRRWDCKYHGVYIPKCRKKRIFGQLRRPLGEAFLSWRISAVARLWWDT